MSTPQLPVPKVPPRTILELHDKLQPRLVSGLWSREGQAAQDHLLIQRRLPKKLVEREGIGYLPPGRNVLVKLCKDLGLSLEVAVAAGLVKREEQKALKSFQRRRGGTTVDDGNAFATFWQQQCAEDPFYYRDYHVIVKDQPAEDARGEAGAGSVEVLHGDWLTIPIRITAGQQVRIGGWQLRSNRPTAEIGKQGRYRNPVNTAAMQWNQVLIGLADEQPRIDRSQRAVVCEGYFDRLATIAALEADPRTAATRPGVVALGGIAVRGRQEDALGVLGQLAAPRLSLLLDNDGPGIEAVLKVGPLWAGRGQHVGVCRLQDSGVEASAVPKDVGELFQTTGGEAVLRVLAAGAKRGLVTFALDQVAAQRRRDPIGGTTRRTMEACDELLPLLVALPEETLQPALAKTSQVLGLPTELLGGLIGDARAARLASRSEGAPATAPAPEADRAATGEGSAPAAAQATAESQGAQEPGPEGKESAPVAGRRPSV